MKDVKSIVSKNLGALRKQRGLTQAELAEKLNYSDKAISRWEKGDTLPDLNVLYDICQFYGITMNDLVGEECEAEKIDESAKYAKLYRIWMCALSGAVIMLFAVILFLYRPDFWIVFMWALPLTSAVVCISGRSLLNWIVKFILVSFTMWTTILAVYLHMLFFIVPQENFWQIFILGVPLQAIAFLSQMMVKHRYKKQEITNDNDGE